MRIAILTDTSLWGGLETHAAALAQTLDRAGHRLTIYCLDARSLPLFRKAVPQTIDVAELKKPARDGFLAWMGALSDVDADAVLLEKGTLNTGSFALDCALRFKFRRYVTYQQLEPPKLPPKSRCFIDPKKSEDGRAVSSFRFQVSRKNKSNRKGHEGCTKACPKPMLFP